MHMTRLLVTAVLLSLLGTLGCKTVQHSDLAGTWMMKDSSRQFLPTELQNAVPKIVLDPNGTFVASEIPEELPPPPTQPYDPKRRTVRLDSGSGVWKLVFREGKQQIQLNFQTMQGNKDVPYGTQIDVSMGRSVMSLYYFLGDADEGRRVTLEKVAPAGGV